jgi:Late embryogenesis abundant protein
MWIRQLYRPNYVWLIVALVLIGVALLLASGCAALTTLGQLIQPPRFEQADQPADLRLIGPSLSHPAGGAGVTLWIEVTNPNPFGFTLSTLDTTLLLEGQHAATGNFPLGLPLGAGQESVVPIDLTIGFADLPGLANVVRQAVSGQPVTFQLDGTVGVDAGQFGQPTFGPMLLVRGQLGAP